MTPGNATGMVQNTERGELWLDGVTTLSDSAAISLAKHVGDLSLRQLATLSDVGFQALQQHEGDLDDCLNDRLILSDSSSLSGAPDRALGESPELAANERIGSAIDRRPKEN
jgi:hypothetical protein